MVIPSSLKRLMFSILLIQWRKQLKETNKRSVPIEVFSASLCRYSLSKEHSRILLLLQAEITLNGKGSKGLVALLALLPACELLLGY